MPVAKGGLADPRDCYLGGSALSDSNLPTRSHLIPRRWFDTPPPADLPTLPACFACNNDLSGREERLRNELVRMFSHDPAQHADVFQRAARSRQSPPHEMKPGYYDT